MVYCANCYLCRVFTDGDGYRRVRCAADQWLTPSGQVKTYSYHTVLNRIAVSCEFYVSMGETAEFLKDLAVELPPTKELTRVDRAVV